MKYSSGYYEFSVVAAKTVHDGHENGRALYESVNSVRGGFRRGRSECLYFRLRVRLTFWFLRTRSRGDITPTADTIRRAISIPWTRFSPGTCTRFRNSDTNDISVYVKSVFETFRTDARTYFAKICGFFYRFVYTLFRREIHLAGLS